MRGTVCKYNFIRALFITLCFAFLTVCHPRAKGREVLVGHVAFTQSGDTAEVNLIGCFSDGRFSDGLECQPLVKKGESFSLYASGRITGKGKITDIPAPSTDTPDEGTIYFTASISEEIPVKGTYVFAVFDDSAPEKINVTSISSKNVTHQNIVKNYLISRGITKEHMNTLTLTQVLSVDMNRDRKNEVFLNFTSAPEYMGFESKPGDFYVLLMRYLTKNGKVKTSEVFQQIHSDPEQRSFLPETREIAGFYDLNKDGVLEVITAGNYYEGNGFDIYEFKNGVFKTVASWWAGV